MIGVDSVQFMFINLTLQKMLGKNVISTSDIDFDLEECINNGIMCTIITNTDYFKVNCQKLCLEKSILNKCLRTHA